ncbi:MAG: GNAT family N-acetyltransferase [Pseudomonadota bacterium]
MAVDLFLQRFRAGDLNDFSALHADPNVMKDLGGPITRAEAHEKLTRYIAAYDRHGYGRVAVFADDTFAGYTGVQHLSDPTHPLTPHDEIGWRLLPRFWGHGIASRAATLCLEDAFTRAGLRHVLAYTSPDNHRSQAVIARLGFERAQALDFEEDYPPLGTWHGLVWRLNAPAE